jgi:hypothetical protein
MYNSLKSYIRVGLKLCARKVELATGVGGPGGRNLGPIYAPHSLC